MYSIKNNQLIHTLEAVSGVSISIPYVLPLKFSDLETILKKNITVYSILDLEKLLHLDREYIDKWYEELKKCDNPVDIDKYKKHTAIVNITHIQVIPRILYLLKNAEDTYIISSPEVTPNPPEYYEFIFDFIKYYNEYIYSAYIPKSYIDIADALLGLYSTDNTKVEKNVRIIQEFEKKIELSMQEFAKKFELIMQKFQKEFEFNIQEFFEKKFEFNIQEFELNMPKYSMKKILFGNNETLDYAKYYQKYQDILSNLKSQEKMSSDNNTDDKSYNQDKTSKPRPAY